MPGSFLSSIGELWRVRRALQGLAPLRQRCAASDPTMLFFGLMLGAHAYESVGFHRALWPLKQALFYHGDRIVEAYINALGIDRLEMALGAHDAARGFFLFPPEDIARIGCEDEHRWLGALYGETRERVASLPLPADARAQIMAALVDATQRALASTFVQRDWDKIDLSRQVEWREALQIVTAQERAKNVAVVTRLLSVKHAIGGFPDHGRSDEEIVSAASRFFTLLDDPLDLAEDLALRLPNFVFAMAMRHGQWPALEAAIRSSGSRASGSRSSGSCSSGSRSSGSSASDGAGPGEDPWSMIARAVPETWVEYSESYAVARARFVETFPVAPRLLAWWVERRARNGQSPF